MSGRHTCISHDAGRRGFLKRLGALLAVPVAAPLFTGCGNDDPRDKITGSIVGANHKTGHLLRAGKFPEPTERMTAKVLIAGGGITGLSARRWLLQNGIADVLMLEMDERVGGNSVSGVNQYSAYPWGAHYLPLPDLANKELLDFLSSIDVIKSFDANGLPVYNEYYLLHDPEERLYVNGYWQDGLVPHVGVGKEDSAQIARFGAEMEQLRTAVGSDGKPFFRIPLDSSSTDDTWRNLDAISFDQYLTEKGYTSPYLRWYLEYCCKDDYGSTLKQTSAWAGIHYFASRKGKAANAVSPSLLTWPEGNAFLMNALKRQSGGQTRAGMLVHQVEQVESGVEVVAYDVAAGRSVAIMADKVLLSTPQYVTKHLLGAEYKTAKPSYAPWVVANITIDSLPHTRGVPLSWDNVIYGQESVGYVYANHQDLDNPRKAVITYYLPVTANDPVAARQSIYNNTFEQWRDRVIRDLSFAHPGIERCISHMDVWIWGHGMVRPSPGYIWGKERQDAQQPIDNKIFFAHTDLCGISIFEEAFYQGINAAKQIIASI